MADLKTKLRQKQELIDFLSEYVTPPRLSRMRSVLEKRTRHLCLVMEDIYQSQNASAVLRSCDCFGIQDVHIIENHNVYEINPDVALGASKWLSLYKYNNREHNTSDCLTHLKEAGYRIVATSPHRNDLLLEELPVDQRTALLFGTELKGLTQEATGMADAFVKIPMLGFTESFNISVSAAICLYHLGAKIRETVRGWMLSEEEKTDLLLEWIKQSVKNPESLIQYFFDQKQATR